MEIVKGVIPRGLHLQSNDGSNANKIRAISGCLFLAAAVCEMDLGSGFQEDRDDLGGHPTQDRVIQKGAHFRCLVLDVRTPGQKDLDAFDVTIPHRILQRRASSAVLMFDGAPGLDKGADDLGMTVFGCRREGRLSQVVDAVDNASSEQEASDGRLARAPAWSLSSVSAPAPRSTCVVSESVA